MATAAEKEGDFSATILKQLECPVCLEYCTPPIRQCSNGHNICSDCFPKVKECAMCRGPMTNVRNLFAEQVSATIEYPCKFKSEGCSHKSPLSAMDEHLTNCNYGFTCQMKVRDKNAVGPNNVYVQCNWRGKYTNLRAHVESNHHEWAARGTKINVSFSLRKFQAILVSCHGELFWCFFCLNGRLQSQQAYVCYIGAEGKNEQFTYEINLSSQNGDCAIVNKGNVALFRNGLVEEYEKDESGKNTIVSGNHMLHRFTKDNIFHCNIKFNKK